MDHMILDRPAPPTEEIPFPEARSIVVRPDRSAPDNSLKLPTVGPGEFWLISHPSDQAEPTAFERHALTAANVIVYDRALTSTVAEILPLGGYAEPAAGDGMERCVQFVRDGWSVVRLLACVPAERDFATHLTLVAARLHGAGASSDLAVTKFTQIDGGRFRRTETRLGKIETLSGDLTDRAAQAIAFRAFGCRYTPGLGAVVSNGLAG